ncbi:MAG: DUF2203 domain-containing protein [Planctomycetaceae bacterium]|nr:DUF2203 domain-containing protein [Planctomycetaceae bacterium]
MSNRLNNTTQHARPARTRRKHFSIDHANRCLVLLNRVVADIVVEYQRLGEYQETLEAGGSDDDVRRRTEGLLTRSVTRIRMCLEELDDLGVEITDWSRGSVDFPSLAAGREIRLCWALGEDRVRFWHEVNEDPAARRAIDTVPIADAAPAEL